MNFAPAKLRFKLASVVLLVIGLLCGGLNVNAQSRKSAANKKDKKQTAKVAKNEKADKKADKKSKTEKSERADKKADKKGSKLSKAEIAAARREEAERRREAARREEERRQAILAERRRREQIAREARARQLAFENGLRTETLDNIAKDDITGEDLEVRRAAVNALVGHAGTVVVMEPQTGKVLSIVNQDWAIRKGFKPCSTIKLVTGVAGLNENLIDENGDIRKRSFPMELDDALAHSNNSYFQKVGADLGNQKMIDYARDLGLGQPTGINAVNESSGKLPFGNNGAKIYSHGEDFEVTPIQLAVMVSTISNGGKRVVPQIPRTTIEKTNFRGAMNGTVHVSQDKLQGVLPGMIGAVNYGTARRSGASNIAAAGKTGSCIGQGSWLGLFASVAPVVNPQLAVVVITRGSSERGKYASAIAGKVYAALGNRFQNNGTTNNLIAKTPLELRPQSKVNAKTSALVDEGEGEESEEGDVAATTQNGTKRVNPKKGEDEMLKSVAPAKTLVSPGLVKKTTQQTPTNQNAKPSNMFDPIIIQTNKMSRPRIVKN